MLRSAPMQTNEALQVKVLLPPTGRSKGAGATQPNWLRPWAEMVTEDRSAEPVLLTVMLKVTECGMLSAINWMWASRGLPSRSSGEVKSTEQFILAGSTTAMAESVLLTGVPSMTLVPLAMTVLIVLVGQARLMEELTTEPP